MELTAQKHAVLQIKKSIQGQGFLQTAQCANNLVHKLSNNHIQFLKTELKAKVSYLKKMSSIERVKKECEKLAENTSDLHIAICFEESKMFIPQKGGRGKTSHTMREVYDNRNCFKGIKTHQDLETSINRAKQVKNIICITPRLIKEVRENNKSNYRIKAKAGHPEYYTPPKIIKKAKLTMGSIDLDPASCAVANKNVKAKRYFTKTQDGLSKVWMGNIWLNPPFTYGVIDAFIDKLQVKSYKQAVVITNNNTETKWGQKLLQLSNCVCFPKSRVKFWDKKGEYPKSPVQGQMIVGIGVDVAKFKAQFKDLGIVIDTTSRVVLA